MSRSRTLAMFLAIFATLIVWNAIPPSMHADTDSPKAGLKWEYATLSYAEPIRGGEITYAIWSAKNDFSDPFTNLEKQLKKELNQKERFAYLGILLDYFGHNRWELVAATSQNSFALAAIGAPAPAPTGVTTTLRFKRPMQ